MKLKKPAVRLFCLLTAAVLLLCCTGCGRKTERYVTCIADMYDMELSVGYPDDVASLEANILEICPGAQLKPQNDLLAIDSVAAGKLDCYAAGRFYLDGYMKEHPDCGLTILDEPLIVFYAGLGLSDSAPIDNYAGRVNECIAMLKSDGTLADMERRWVNGEDETMPDIPLPENPDYTLRVATYGQQKPNTYVKDNRLVGLDIELSYRVAAYLGCGVRFETASYPAMLIGIAEGKYDMIAADLYITGDRQENMTFSTPYQENPVSLIVREDPAAKKVYNSIGDLQQAKKFGSTTGSVMDAITREHFPDAQVFQYNSLIDEVAALTAGKIDAILYDAPTLKYICAEHTELKLLPELLDTEDYHIAAAKNSQGQALMAEFDSWLEEKRADGTLDEMESFWTGTASPAGRIDFNIQPGNGGTTLRVGYDAAARPDNFIFENQPAGYTVELAARFCSDRGYGLEMVQVKADAFINSLDSGKIDMYVALLSYTDERAENVTFSNPILSGGIGAAVRNESASAESGGKGIGRSFRKTFIDENRWKMLLSGFGVTMLITAGGFLLANILGALFCAMSVSDRRTLRALEDIYSRIMQGTPIVVVLMILYYVIFGRSRISGIWVAIMGFGLSSGAGLSQLFRGGITAVDKGQREAALALGFTKVQTFFGITLPQAIRTMLPGWFSNLIALMKGTAIVGYIAVVDLTKTSDMIRSSTYEAFFPLISVALVYFLIASLLLSAMKAILKKLAPKRRTAEEVGK